jgi:hypothetical protein
VAEEVEISNVGNGGTVASEETLAKLVAAVEKMGGGNGDGAKVQALYNQSVKAGTTENVKNTNSQKSNTDALDENTKSVKYAQAALNALKTGMGQLLGSAVGLTKELVMGGDSVADFTKHIPLVGGYLAPLAGIIDANVESFRQLSQVGATFGDGMNDIRAISAAAGIPLGEFTQLVSENSQTMRLFGAGTADGARNFAALSKEMRDGPGRAFINMGYTATELNESLIEYAEFSQTQIGNDRRNNKLTAQSAANYLETIDQLAAVTGKRRDQIKEEMNAAQADQRARLAMSRMSEEEQTRFAANLAAAPESLKAALTDAADGVMDNELAQGLSVASKTFREQAGNIQNMNAREYNNFMAQVGRELDQAGTNLGAGAQQIINSGTGFGQAIAMGADLRNIENMSQEEYNRILDERNAQAERDNGILQLQNSLRDLRTTLMDAFINSGALKSIQDGLGRVAEIVGTQEFQDAMATGVKALVAGVEFLVGAFSNLVNFFSEIGDTFGSAGVIAAIIAGFGALFGAKALVSGVAKAASAGIESKLSSIFGGGGGADAAPGASTPRTRTPSRGGGMGASVGRNAAAAGGGIGKGLGNLGGGILKGIAGGLKAFANPQVAIGAAVVAGVILVIGAAIAGASWLLGKSLPTLVEGIKSFETIDGDKLKNAAVGMLAVSGAMVAFGAGSAVAGLGALVGGITEGIGKLFGAEDPLEKVKRFADADIDGAKVKSNAEAMVAFSTAMAAAGGASAAEGLGSLVSGIAGGIGALFGGDTTEDIFEDMMTFASYDIDTAKVKNNAEAMAAFSAAMAAAGGGAAASGAGNAIGAVGNAIASFFGQDTPLEQVKEFGETELNVAQIEANANAIRTMGGALSGFTEVDLDKTPIIEYTEAIKGLVEALDQLNEELKQDNDTLMTSRADAGELLSGISTSSRGTAEGTSQLNTTMQAMLQTLTEIKETNAKVERNTKAITSGNIAAGYVSTTGT